MRLARALADAFRVHVMDRRGRPGSSSLRPGHSIDDECADLAALARATGATAVFGHSFGGLVALEVARRGPIFDAVYAYEPGISVGRQLQFGWLNGYARRLDGGDRRGAFAWMVKNAGFAPGVTRMMPVWYLRFVLRIALRGERWCSMDSLLEASLVEHRIVAALDAPDAGRFSTITAKTLLLAGAKSPDLVRTLLDQLARAIPNATTAVLPGLDHLAPEERPTPIAAAILTNCRQSGGLLLPQPTAP
jgi:pimeloyl-ACP methyl ester carboxylesterase